MLVGRLHANLGVTLGSCRSQTVPSLHQSLCISARGKVIDMLGVVIMLVRESKNARISMMSPMHTGLRTMVSVFVAMARVIVLDS